MSQHGFARDNVFELIEKTYSLEVIIASHPTSNYCINDFNGRKIFKGVTNELVKNSKLVLNTVSTSYSFAIFFNKPIIFFYTNDIEKYYFQFRHKDACVNLARLFNYPVYNISDNIKIKPFPLTITNSMRLSYIYNYYSSPETESIENEVLISEFLHNINE
jgi:hypothetical protein